MASKLMESRGAGDNKKVQESEEPLDDFHESEFASATLTISPDNDRSPSPGAMETTGDRNENVVAREKMSSSSATGWTVPPNNRNSLENRKYFADREGAFERAVENCKPVVLENLDGFFHGAWLLTEIDHWDNEKERVLILTEKSLLVIKYDFIALQVLEYRRILLTELDCIIHGEMNYPENSVVPPRQAKGLRALWNKGKPIQFSKNWNPWSRDIPFITFTAHHLFYSDAIQEKQNYNIETFALSIIATVQALNNNRNGSFAPCLIKEEPILIENYVGLASVIHNAVDLGFFKSRGRISF